MNWFGKKNKKNKAAGLTEAAGGQVDSDDHLFRRLGDTERDLNPVTHSRMLKIAGTLYDRNPLAHRIVELTKDFIVADGITYTAEDDDVKAVLDDFWNDSVNNWDIKQFDKAMQLGLWGEQIWQMFVNKHSGKVRVGNIDPLQVPNVITDPENAEQVIKVIKNDKDNAEGIPLEVVDVDEGPGSKTVGYLVGDVFFFTVNKVSNAKRGRSDLLALADWIDGYNNMLFNQIDREALINAFVWDVTLEGMNEEEIAAWLKKNPSPKPGSVRAHNEKVKWDANAPDLKGADSKERANIIRRFILSGAGFPDHWFGDGSGTNRATAAEMGVPTIKRLKARQRYFKYMITMVFKFVIDQAIIHGTLKEDVDKTFTLNFPELVVKDIAVAATAVNAIVLSAVTALNNGVISEETALKWIQAASDLLGVEIDAVEEIKKAKPEREKRDIAESINDYSDNPHRAEPGP